MLWQMWDVVRMAGFVGAIPCGWGTISMMWTGMGWWWMQWVKTRVAVVVTEARWLGDFVYLPVCRVLNTIALGSNVWVGALMVSTESTPGILVFQMKV